jgi:hypothetical protein
LQLCVFIAWLTGLQKISLSDDQKKVFADGVKEAKICMATVSALQALGRADPKECKTFPDSKLKVRGLQLGDLPLVLAEKIQEIGMQAQG